MKNKEIARVALLIGIGAALIAFLLVEKNKIDVAEVYCGIGNTSMQKGRYEEAIEYYQDALAVDSQCYEAYVGLGTAYESSKNYKKSLEYYKKSLRLISGRKGL